MGLFFYVTTYHLSKECIHNSDTYSNDCVWSVLGCTCYVCACLWVISYYRTLNTILCILPVAWGRVEFWQFSRLHGPRNLPHLFRFDGIPAYFLISLISVRYNWPLHARPTLINGISIQAVCTSLVHKCIQRACLIVALWPHLHNDHSSGAGHSSTIGWRPTWSSEVHELGLALVIPGRI